MSLNLLVFLTLFFCLVISEETTGVTLCHCEVPESWYSNTSFFFVSNCGFKPYLETALFKKDFVKLKPCLECDIQGAEMFSKADIVWAPSKTPKSFRDMMNPEGYISYLSGVDHIVHKSKMFKHIDDMWYQKGFQLFTPETLILTDSEQYRVFLEILAELDAGSNELWIVKPVDRTRGMGMRVVDGTEMFFESFSDKIVGDSLPSHIAQKYIMSPLLLNGRKFDIRVYFLLLSTDPVIAFYSFGALRLSVAQYDIGNIDNIPAHITNWHQQKDHPNFKLLQEDIIWETQQFEDYLVENNIAGENYVSNTLNVQLMQRMELAVQSCLEFLHLEENQFSLLGFDFIIDDNLNPILIEVTKGPGACFKCDHFQETIDDMISLVTEAIALRKSGEPLSNLSENSFKKLSFDKQSYTLKT